ncbi:cell division protein FtsZ [bacterium]|nr:cell division protein FtsZ [candidate division CSSED10-310 bacterium]
MYSFIEEVAINQANIKVIGIGGGGCNAVERMLQRRMKGVEFIACNTDMQSLQQYHAQTCLQLGRNLTRGLGAGGNPKIGRAAALEDEEMIRTHLAGSDMVFITSGMGGGTGTGGAPVIAQAAREMGILTVAVVTLPFRFEGKRRQKIAETGIRDLEEIVDTLIVVPNEKILAVVDPDTTVRAAFTKADEILSNAVQGISDLITESGEINVDFADVRTIMTDMGKAILGTGVAAGENRAITAVDAAISSPLLDTMSINGARGILINITSGDDLGMMEVHAACERVAQAADEDALIIFGHVFNTEYMGKMKITIIATGFEKPKVRNHSLNLSSQESKKPPITGLPDAVEPHRIPVLESSRSEPNVVSLVTDLDSVQNAESVLCSGAREEAHVPIQNRESEDRAHENAEPVHSHVSQGHLRLAPPETPVLFPSEELTRVNPVTPVRKPPQPELEPVQRNRLRDDFPSIPDYNRRDMASNSLKKDTKLDRIAQRIYYGDINTPAFLRRKAD